MCSCVLLLSAASWYQLPPCCRVLENLTVPMLVRLFPAFCGTRKFITSYEPATCANPSPDTSRPYLNFISWRSVLILSSHLSLGLPNCFFPSGFPTETGWMIRQSNPGGCEIFRTRPDRPQSAPSCLYNGYHVPCPGVKRPVRGVDHPPPPSAEFKERVELYLYPRSGPSWKVIQRSYFFLTKSSVHFASVVHLRLASVLLSCLKTGTQRNIFARSRISLLTFYKKEIL